MGDHHRLIGEEEDNEFTDTFYFSKGLSFEIFFKDGWGRMNHFCITKRYRINGRSNQDWP